MHALEACISSASWTRCSMLTYADVCWRMLTYADVCWRMLTYADVCCLHAFRVFSFVSIPCFPPFSRLEYKLLITCLKLFQKSLSLPYAEHFRSRRERKRVKKNSIAVWCTARLADILHLCVCVCVFVCVCVCVWERERERENEHTHTHTHWAAERNRESERQ